MVEPWTGNLCLLLRTLETSDAPGESVHGSMHLWDLRSPTTLLVEPPVSHCSKTPSCNNELLLLWMNHSGWFKCGDFLVNSQHKFSLIYNEVVYIYICNYSIYICTVRLQSQSQKQVHIYVHTIGCQSSLQATQAYMFISWQIPTKSPEPRNSPNLNPIPDPPISRGVTSEGPLFFDLDRTNY